MATRATCTILDNGTVAARLGSDGLAYPRGLTAEERLAAEATYAAWPEPGPHPAQGPGFHCRAWAALPERNGIRRVCLLTFPMGDHLSLRRFSRDCPLPDAIPRSPAAFPAPKGHGRTAQGNAGAALGCPALFDVFDAATPKRRG